MVVESFGEKTLFFHSLRKGLIVNNSWSEKTREQTFSSTICLKSHKPSPHIIKTTRNVIKQNANPNDQATDFRRFAPVRLDGGGCNVRQCQF